MILISVFISALVIFLWVGKKIYKNEKVPDNFYILITIFSFIFAAIATGIGTDLGCSDGWNSSSIGKQGACSHHGGVAEKLNDTGYIIFLFSIIINIGALLIYIDNTKKENQENKIKKQEQEVITKINEEKIKKLYIENINFLISNKDIIRKAKIGKQIIGFDYMNNNGEESYREIIPKTINNRNGTTTGFCFKRNEKRVFSIKKMKNIKIIDNS